MKINKYYSCIFLLILMSIVSCSKKNNEFSPVMKTLFGIHTKHEFTIPVPETSATCELDSFFLETESSTDIIGSYSIGNETGTIVTDSIDIIPVNNFILDEYYSNELKSSSNDFFYFALPFVVSNQGSGIFRYLGLFCLDNKTGKMFSLQASQLLGDRIKIESITPLMRLADGGLGFDVIYYEYDKNQAMAEEPLLKTKKTIIFYPK